jgi:hypothetical protein
LRRYIKRVPRRWKCRVAGRVIRPYKQLYSESFDNDIFPISNPARLPRAKMDKKSTICELAASEDILKKLPMLKIRRIARIIKMFFKVIRICRMEGSKKLFELF